MRSTEETRNSDTDHKSLSRPQHEREHLFQARDVALGGFFGALGIVVPIIFHAVGMGKVFLPMYLPILAAGLMVSWEVGLIVGLATPLLSAVLTGMPPLAPPVAVLMAFELASLAAIAGLARRVGVGIWPATIAGIIAARVVGTVTLVTVGRLLGLQQTVWQYALASIVLSWPGLLLQLTVVPGVVYSLERSTLLGSRWRRETA